jgi:hypothetical protein
MPADVNALLNLPKEKAFKQWLAVPGEWVEEPNVRRGGESGVKRVMTTEGKMLYRKQQIGHTFRSWRFPFGYPTAMREKEVLLACAALNVSVPKLVYADCLKVSGTWHAQLITEALDGFTSLEDCYANEEEKKWGEALHLRILYEFGSTLARFNLGRWQHGCMRLKHVFVKLQGEQIQIAFIDLEKSKKKFSADQAARNDIQQLKRHIAWNQAQWSAFLKGHADSFGRQLIAAQG